MNISLFNMRQTECKCTTVDCKNKIANIFGGLSPQLLTCGACLGQKIYHKQTIPENSWAECTNPWCSVLFWVKHDYYGKNAKCFECRKSGTRFWNIKHLNIQEIMVIDKNV